MTLVQSEPKSIKIGTTNIKKVTIRPNGTEKQIRPAGWTPGANTIAYYPLTSQTTINDMSGNGYNLTTNGTCNFNTYQGVDCFNSQATGWLNCSSLKQPTVGNAFTVNCYVYTTNTTTRNEWGIIGQEGKTGGYKGWSLFENYYSGQNQAYRGETLGSSNLSISSDKNFGTRYNLCMVYSTGTNNQKFYINGTQVGQNTNNMNIDNNAYLWIGRRVWSDGTQDNIRSGGVSKVIIENKVRTNQEVLDYYNQTKGNYGL